MDNKEIVAVFEQHRDDAAFVAACRADVRAAIDYVVERSRARFEPVTDTGRAVDEYLADGEGNAAEYLLDLLPEDEALALSDSEVSSAFQTFAENAGFRHIGELVAEAGWTEACDNAKPYDEEALAEQMRQWREENDALRSEYYASVL